MDHGYEIIALAAQPPELKHAKCINADQKKGMPGAIRQCNKRSLNDISQLILWIYLRQVHTYELRPAISAQPSWTKMCKTISFIVRKRLVYKELQWSMAFPNSFCEFVFARPIDMTLDPLFLRNRLDRNEATKLDYYSETVEFYTRFWKNDVFPQKWSKKMKPFWIITRKRFWNDISPNSFCEFDFARAIDMTRHSCTTLWTKTCKQFDFFSRKRLNCTQRFWNDIPELILWIFSSAIDMNLDPPFHSCKIIGTKNNNKKLIYYPERLA